MYKAIVKDRTKFKTIWDESKLIDPVDLQQIIETAVLNIGEGKAFVRPSGTEDILRLYSEASTLEDVEKLANDILSQIESKFKEF